MTSFISLLIMCEYLVEYCVCKGSKSIHYIRTVGLAWAEAGISTVGQAKERTTTYRRNTFAIMKAFGINDRNPVDPELSYIEKWLNTYDFYPGSGTGGMQTNHGAAS